MINRLVTNIYARKCILVLCRILSYINRIIPKKRNWILFYESVNGEFHDNSRALYNYMKNFKTGYIYFICVSNTRKNQKLASKNTIIINQITGSLIFMLCKYCFYSYSSLRIKPAPNQIVVNQWHGSPLKVIGKLSNDKYNRGEDMCDFTYVLAASKFFAKIMKEAFDCNPTQVLICGHARTDELFDDFTNPYIETLKNYKKKIIWMPTFRISKDLRHRDLGDNYDYVNTETFLPLFEKENDLKKLDEYCQSQNYILIIKIHTLAQIKKFHFNNIHIFKDEDLENNGMSLYQFLKEFDVLITDYSSVYFDYLLLNRPIGFIVNDIDLYNSARGFVVESPLDYMPGKHIHSILEFYSFLQEIGEDKDPYEYERQKICEITNYYQDGDNSERLLKKLDII